MNHLCKMRLQKYIYMHFNEFTCNKCELDVCTRTTIATRTTTKNGNYNANDLINTYCVIKTSLIKPTVVHSSSFDILRTHSSRVSSAIIRIVICKISSNNLFFFIQRCCSIFLSHSLGISKKKHWCSFSWIQWKLSRKYFW